MPIYEYQCESCRKKLEVIQRFSDAPTTECPECGGAMRKLISSPAIQFKGSGFYITDYGKSGGSGGGEKSGGGGDSSSSTSSASSTSSDSSSTTTASTTKTGSSSD